MPAVGGAVRAGLTGAAEGYGGAVAKGGLLGSAGTAPGAIGADGVPQVVRAGVPVSLGDVTTPLIGSAGATGAADATGALTASQAPGLAGRLAGAGGKVLDFAENHPPAAAGALQGIGSIASSGTENRLRSAQANAIEQQVGETAFDFEQRKRREALLAPIWSALGTGVGREPNIAPNPYTTARG